MAKKKVALNNNSSSTSTAAAVSTANAINFSNSSAVSQGFTDLSSWTTTTTTPGLQNTNILNGITSPMWTTTLPNTVTTGDFYYQNIFPYWTALKSADTIDGVSQLLTDVIERQIQEKHSDFSKQLMELAGCFQILETVIVKELEAIDQITDNTKVIRETSLKNLIEKAAHAYEYYVNLYRMLLENNTSFLERLQAFKLGLNMSK